MSEIKLLLFEDPTALLIALGFAELILVVVWLKLRSRKVALALAIPALLAGGVSLTARLVTTERERLTQSVHALAHAVQARDIDAIAAMVDPNYDDPLHRGKDQVVAAARNVLSAYRLKSVQLSNLTVQINGSTGLTRFTARVELDGGFFGGRVMPTHWRLEWARHGDRWLVTRAVLASSGFGFGRREVPR